MTERRDNFHAYPLVVEAGGSRATLSYSREKLYFAVQGKIAENINLPVKWKSREDAITVFEGEPWNLETAIAPERLRPVYRLLPDGPMVIPTGMVFARFEESLKAEERSSQLAEAGYEIDTVPAYAPHCAWLKPADGQVSSGLARIATLRKVPGIVNVEPQMLGPSAKR